MGGGMYTSYHAGTGYEGHKTHVEVTYICDVTTRQSLLFLQASFPMQAHDGWVCRDPFGVGSTVCFAQCGTFASNWPKKGLTVTQQQSLFRTVSAVTTANSSTVEVSCPAGHTMLSGGRAIEFSNVWNNATKDFDINEVSFMRCTPCLIASGTDAPKGFLRSQYACQQRLALQFRLSKHKSEMCVNVSYYFPS